MKFDKKALFSALVGVALLANILELTHVNFLGISTLLSFFTCILLPGFLLSLILRIGKISLWENLLIIVGLSLAFLEFGGLLLNILLPLIGIHDPLAFRNLVIGFDVYMLLLFIVAWRRTQPFVVLLQLPRRSRFEKALYMLPLFFPVLATLGAIILNNGGSNILTLILLGAIACYSFFLVIMRGKVPADVFPYTIFFIAIACLFTTSLRSWYITGHDIEREFYVFELTNAHHLWNMAFYQDAYNACLSITILPTILTNLLSVQDMYIYKVVFQILFATSPVLVFFILRKYTTPVYAFLAAFVFMSFPTFFNDMPMLNRQEIGFIFFGLVLYVMLNRLQPRYSDTIFEMQCPPALPPDALSLSMKRRLFLIFALSVIVSHYSTNFVLLALVVMLYLLTSIISLPSMKNTIASLRSRSFMTVKNVFTSRKRMFAGSMVLTLPLILIMFGMTYAWNNLYTHASDQYGSIVTEVISSIFVSSNNDNKSTDLSYSLFFAPKLNPQQELQQYIKSTAQAAEANNAGKANSNQLYSKSITGQYRTYLLPEETLPSTPLGNVLTALHIPVFEVQSDLKSLSADLLQLFVLVGLPSLYLLRKKKSFDLQFLLLCFSALFLLALITLLPALSVEYGALRMFQQLLFILSLPMIFGIGSFLFFIHEQKRIIVIGLIAVVLFLNLTGFVSHLTGGFYPVLTLDNSGLYYDAYYVHRSDVLAVDWLARNDVNNEPVAADSSALNKLLTYGGIDGVNENFPSILPRDAYVYQEVSMNKFVVFADNTLIINSDKPFLDANKNLIYSNGSDNIYK